MYKDICKIRKKWWHLNWAKSSYKTEWNYKLEKWEKMLVLLQSWYTLWFFFCISRYASPSILWHWRMYVYHSNFSMLCFGLDFFVVVFFKFFFKVTYKAHCVSCDNGNELKPSGIGQSDPNTVLGTSAQTGLRANLPPVLAPNGVSQSECRSTLRKSASAPFDHRNLLDP